MKKADRILIITVRAAAVLLLAFRHVTRSPGGSVTVTVDGVNAGTWPISEDREVTVEGIGGSNVLVISGGTASVREADCPDGICVKQRPVRYTGETIVCLPHRVVITVTGDEAPALDGVAK